MTDGAQHLIITTKPAKLRMPLNFKTETKVICVILIKGFCLCTLTIKEKKKWFGDK